LSFSAGYETEPVLAFAVGRAGEATFEKVVDRTPYLVFEVPEPRIERVKI
jgi:hypothetical protein